MTKPNVFDLAEQGDASGLEAALAQGGKVEAPGDRGESPLTAAAAQGHLACVALLLAHGARVNHKNSGGATALMAASHAGHVAVVEKLLASGADAGLANSAGVTPLFAATAHADVVRALLVGKVNPNQPTRSGRLPLSAAKSVAVASALVDGGASLDARDAEGRTALHHAASDGRGEVVGWLLDAGASADVVDNDGATPLAAGSRALLGANATPVVLALARATRARDAKGYRGQTALSVAAELGRLDAVEQLLKEGAGRDTPDAAAMTPLMWAAYENHAPVVAFLLGAGADKTARDKDGKTALDLVLEAQASEGEGRSSLRRRRAPVDRSEVISLLSR
jgi:ankyrin repeat protein